MNSPSNVTRRQFLRQTTTALGAALAAPSLIPASASGDSGARDGISLIPSNRDANRSAEGGLALDAKLDGGLCPGANLQTDPQNCGGCKNICTIPHAQAGCVAGLCVVATCGSGYVDLDRKPENGCECLQSTGGVEICDGVDNNCNGLVD